jgi:hypothetical protein
MLSLWEIFSGLLGLSEPAPTRLVEVFTLSSPSATTIWHLGDPIDFSAMFVPPSRASSAGSVYGAAADGGLPPLVFLLILIGMFIYTRRKR